MRTVRLHSPRDLRFHDEPVPEPGEGEILVRTGSVSVCASDVHWYLDGRIGDLAVSSPLVLGHEASGFIEALGSGVSGLRKGDRVAVEPARPCGKCEWCAKGFFNVCPRVSFMGTPPTDGAFRDCFVWPANLVAGIPSSVSMADAAIVEPLGVGIHAVRLSEVQEGDTVAVLGAGAIGLSTLQYLKLRRPALVLVSDPLADRLDIARRLGADAVCSPDRIEAEAARLTSGRGFDVVFECAGDEGAVLQTARLCRVMGHAIIVGIPYGDSYTFAAGCARRKQLKVSFSRRSNLTMEEAIRLVDDGSLDAAPLVTHTLPLEEIEKAFNLTASHSDGVIRVIIEVSGGPA